jgi:DNA-binding response OmpR family regulator
MNSTDDIVAGDLRISLKYLTVHYKDRVIELSRREFDILCYLASNPGRPVPQSELIEKLFPKTALLNTAEVYVRYIRLKLDAKHPQAVIRTRRGFGYVVGTANDDLQSSEAAA